MKRDHVELDVIFRWRQKSGFDLTLIYDHPDSSEDNPQLIDKPIDFDTDRLDALAADADSYADELSVMFYRNTAVRDTFVRALESVEAYPVHVRLLIDAAAPTRYQAIRWETLRDPGNQFSLATKSRVYFSRFLSSNAFNPVRPLPKEDRLTALVVVANPKGMSDYDVLGAPPLAAVDIDEELRRARQTLGNMRIETLPDEHNPTQRATLKAITQRLEATDGRPTVNLLYLVCHGIVADEPKLLLETAQGSVDAVSAKTLADHITRLASPPTVAALCSCQSAGAGAADPTTQAEPLAPFGPLLAGAGVAVVIAMQGNVTVGTASNFMTEFFEQLAIDGLADRAAAEARRTVQRQSDWWMPVLFSRLRRGRPWYEPRFGRTRATKFENLWKKLAETGCTPVLGSGIVSEIFLPQRHELAQTWVKLRQMPITPATHRDLAKVAQYLSVDSGPDMPPTELRSFLRAHLRGEFKDKMPEVEWGDPLPAIIRKVWERHRDELGENEPYTILASLELPVYVTTSWTDLLECAMEERGIRPTVRSFDWLSDVRFEEDKIAKPTPKKPLVYHAFGSLDDPTSIVLTEDDYFAWLRQWMRHVEGDKTDSIPGPVRAALTDSALLFLGYSLDDWEFRILFQSVKSFPAKRRLKHQHVGVQLRPEASTIDPEAAQDYLERYLGDDKVDIYWGSSRAFLQDLQASRPVL